jgi:hypothetical protein
LNGGTAGFGSEFCYRFVVSLWFAVDGVLCFLALDFEIHIEVNVFCGFDFDIDARFVIDLIFRNWSLDLDERSAVGVELFLDGLHEVFAFAAGHEGAEEFFGLLFS